MKSCARCTTFLEREFSDFRGLSFDLFGTGSSGLGETPKPENARHCSFFGVLMNKRGIS
jgi:hypothetical protein